MKIVHIFWSLRFGGIETMLINIANAQISQNVDVHIIILNDIYEEELLKRIDHKVKIHLIHRKNGSRGFLFVFRLNRLLYKIGPDVIHLHLSKFYVLLWGKKLRDASVVTLHGLPRGDVRGKRSVQRIFPILSLKDKGNVMFIDKIPKVFAISKAVKNDLQQRYGIISTVISNGIIVENFIHRVKTMSKNSVSIVMVSRLEHEKKGQDLLIRAASAFQGKINVTFIGDGESRGYLEQLTINLNATRWVRFLGSQTQTYIAEHLCEYDLFVQPSRCEGFGLTVAEAMAAKVPVLVSEGQGPAEVTCGNEYGWLFENGNVNELIKQIDYIVEHYEEAMNKAERALQYVCSTYDVSITAMKYLQLYKTELK